MPWAPAFPQGLVAVASDPGPRGVPYLKRFQDSSGWIQLGRVASTLGRRPEAPEPPGVVASGRPRRNAGPDVIVQASTVVG